jgi:hypothetical protein
VEVRVTRRTSSSESAMVRVWLFSTSCSTNARSSSVSPNDTTALDRVATCSGEYSETVQ